MSCFVNQMMIDSLAKHHSQFATNEQQDAQEFTSYLLDILHEDVNLILKKPYVENLSDEWCMQHTVNEIGLENWRRFLRRNKSILTNTAMGQFVNRTQCQTCGYNSNSFDPFNIVSVPVVDVGVVFRCTLVRKGPYVLEEDRRARKDSNPKSSSSDNSNAAQSNQGSKSNKAPQKPTLTTFYTSVPRLADAAEIINKISEITGIPEHLLKICACEAQPSGMEGLDDFIKCMPWDKNSMEGPVMQFKKPSSANDVTDLIIFESTLHTDAASKDYEHNQDAVELNRLARRLSQALWPSRSAHFRVGLRVDAMDHRNEWFPGSVIDVDEAKGSVRVHFDLFSHKWDEEYGMADFEKRRVEPLYTHAKPRDRITELPVYHWFEGVKFGQMFYVQLQTEWSTARALAHIVGQAARFIRVSSTDDDVMRRYKLHARSKIAEVIDIIMEHSGMYCDAALRQKKRESNKEGAPVDAFIMNNNMIRKVERCLKYLPFDVRVNGTEAQPTSMSKKEQQQNVEQQQQQPMMEQSFPCSLLTTMGNFFHPRLVLLLHWRGLDLTRVASTESSASSSSNGNGPQQQQQQQQQQPIALLYTKPSMEVHEESRAKFLKHREESASNDNDDDNDNKGDEDSIPISACLTEFCKEQSLDMNDNWKCPKCKQVREGKQSLHLWRMPDLLTFHIKRFNCSARWREKITTKVDFPLTGLDMSEWMHNDANVHVQQQQVDVSTNTIYDLVGVVNHIGGMTGGHYVATCKTSPCSADGVEEVANSYTGSWGLHSTTTAAHLQGDDANHSSSNGWLTRTDSMLSNSNSNGNSNGVDHTNNNHHNSHNNSTAKTNGGGISSKIRQTMRNKEKDAISAAQQRAQMASRSVLESNDPLWLQFDDEVVEPIPQRNICTEAAYVLFYRRRRLTSANVAKYTTLD